MKREIVFLSALGLAALAGHKASAMETPTLTFQKVAPTRFTPIHTDLTSRVNDDYFG